MLPTPSDSGLVCLGRADVLSLPRAAPLVGGAFSAGGAFSVGGAFSAGAHFGFVGFLAQNASFSCSCVGACGAFCDGGAF